jgi:hypothetical protein
MLRIRLLVSMERKFTSAERRKKGYFPKYYLLLVPVGDNQLKGSSGVDQWSGMLKAIKQELRERVEKIETRIDLLQHQTSSRVCSSEKSTQDEIESVYKKIEDQIIRLENRMNITHNEILSLLHKLKEKDMGSEINRGE